MALQIWDRNLPHPWKLTFLLLEAPCSCPRTLATSSHLSDNLILGPGSSSLTVPGNNWPFQMHVYTTIYFLQSSFSEFFLFFNSFSKKKVLLRNNLHSMLFFSKFRVVHLSPHSSVTTFLPPQKDPSVHLQSNPSPTLHSQATTNLLSVSTVLPFLDISCTYNLWLFATGLFHFTCCFWGLSTL